ncbi:MAG TPA: hypothetical protein VIF15_11645 [Polyangiaceae bacterium]
MVLAVCASTARAHAAAPDGAAPRPADNRDQDASRDAEHLRIGALGSVGFPRPLAIEGMVKLERIVALGGEYSVLPPVTVSGVRTTMWAVAADARIFPFGGAFFFGARLGHQHLSADASFTVATAGTISEAFTVDSWFLNPRLGLLWTSKPGLTVGIDAGLQIPFSSSQSSTLPPAALALAGGATSVPQTLGQSVLPTVDLLELGLLF